MKQEEIIFTSESVTEGHPDKICDQISDAILDACLKEDRNARVACETAIKNSTVWVLGELTTSANVNFNDVIQETIENIGYGDNGFGLNYKTFTSMVSLVKQSPDIAQGVNVGEGVHKEQGAGDQGLMFGYASDETPEYMPLPIMLAHKLTRRLSYVRKNNILDYLGPDGKSQVSIVYEDDVPKYAKNILISTQHKEYVSLAQIREDIIKYVIEPICEEYITDDTQFFVNPTGKFVIGGPIGDAGVTGRKIIVDTYGGMGRHGGGAFSGKDPSKVDRSAAYMTRYIAKNIVAAKLAKRCEIQIAYAIGVPDPVSVLVNTFDTGVLSNVEISKIIRENFNLKPAKIIEHLNLKRPIYRETASYGHFGQEKFPWEQLDKVNILKKYVEDKNAFKTDIKENT